MPGVSLVVTLLTWLELNQQCPEPTCFERMKSNVVGKETEFLLAYRYSLKVGDPLKKSIIFHVQGDSW